MSGNMTSLNIRFMRENQRARQRDVLQGTQRNSSETPTQSSSVVEAAKSYIQSMRRERDRAKTEVQSLEGQLDAANTKLEVLDSRHNQTIAEVQCLKDQLDAAITKLEALESQREQAKAEVDEVLEDWEQV